MLWSADELNELFKCQLPNTLEITGVSIDTRRAHPGDLFFALKGVAHDGHEYVLDAANKGCVAIIVERLIYGLPDHCHQIVVKNTFEALNELGRFARRRSHAKIIAITGSVGKTSTKDILRQLLSHFGSVSCAVESYNNHVGVPLSLARMPKEADYGIFEIGMNNPNEIAPLAKMVSPHIAIITTIAPAHIGPMGSEEAIAIEKSTVFEGLEKGGIAIIPHDTPYLTLLSKKASECAVSSILTFGEAPGADYRLLSYEPMDNARKGVILAALPAGEKVEYDFSIPGRHQAQNTLVCLATTDMLNLPQDKICRLFTSISPVQGRGVFYRLALPGHRNITLIDDAYNANLASMQASIRLLANVHPQNSGRRIVVVGEMLELDHEANSHHEQVATLINTLPIDVVYFVGGTPAAYGYGHIIEEKQGLFIPKSDDLKPILLSSIQDGDVVLIKGSKGTRVSVLVNHLLANAISDERS